MHKPVVGYFLIKNQNKLSAVSFECASTSNFLSQRRRVHDGIIKTVPFAHVIIQLNPPRPPHLDVDLVFQGVGLHVAGESNLLVSKQLPVIRDGHAKGTTRGRLFKHLRREKTTEHPYSSPWPKTAGLGHSTLHTRTITCTRAQRKQVASYHASIIKQGNAENAATGLGFGPVKIFASVVLLLRKNVSFLGSLANGVKRQETRRRRGGVHQSAVKARTLSVSDNL